MPAKGRNRNEEPGDVPGAQQQNASRDDAQLLPGMCRVCESQARGDQQADIKEAIPEKPPGLPGLLVRRGDGWRVRTAAHSDICSFALTRTGAAHLLTALKA